MQNPKKTSLAKVLALSLALGMAHTMPDVKYLGNDAQHRCPWSHHRNRKPGTKTNVRDIPLDIRKAKRKQARKARKANR
jgi:hypothetical protein